MLTLRPTWRTFQIHRDKKLPDDTFEVVPFEHERRTAYAGGIV